MNKIKYCEICGNEFICNTPNKKYCSPSCKKKAEKKVKKEYTRKKKESKHTLSDTLIENKKLGISYADYQRQRTLYKVGKIDTNI